MPRTKKEAPPEKKSLKLYHGTTEAIAKFAPVKGLQLYEVPPFDNGAPRSVCASSADGICLTSVYPGFLAFDTASHRERWGLIEIDVASLSQDLFMPYEGFLIERSKAQINTESERINRLIQLRSNLSQHKRKWKESLEGYGICVYAAPIPANAITKVTIYDPQSNWMITKAILNTNLGGKLRKSCSERNKMLTRWLLGENIPGAEWMAGFEKLSAAERDRITEGLQNKNGLDIFHQGVPNGKHKTSWW